MVVIKVVAMFDDREVLHRARQALLDSGLATEEAIRVEPEEIPTPAREPRTGWERLSEFLATEADHDVSAYAEGLRRGSALLVVETPTERAEDIKDVLRRNGAIDLRRRVNRWITTGWRAFDPDAPTFTEVELLDERRASLSEAAIAADAGIEDGPDRTVSIFEDASGRLLGRLTEAELAVVQDALQEEGPGDDDYWINDQAVEAIAGSPGATPHLVALLRRAVGDSTEGVDIRFEHRGG